MRGLWIKDCKLMKGQKNFFITIVIIAIGMTVFMENPTFTISYMTFVGSMFTLSTISYDEFDNGNAFLFSLPITRESYTVEKYGFGLMVGGASWLFATVIAAAACLVKDPAMLEESIVTALLVLPELLLLLAIMIPFQLKFGGERGRVALIAAVGSLFVIGFIVVKIAGFFQVDLISTFNGLSTLSMGMFAAILLGISAIALLISLRISVGIMKRKEF